MKECFKAAVALQPAGGPGWALGVRAPESLLRKARRRGVDFEDAVVRALPRILGLDPRGEARGAPELAGGPRGGLGRPYRI